MTTQNTTNYADTISVLVEAADQLDSLRTQLVDLAAAIADLRSAIRDLLANPTQ